MKKIIDKFTKLYFESIVRSLFEKDKLIFSFLICTRIMQFEKKNITYDEIRFFLIGGNQAEV